jgi:putative ATP-binding cassette transporter
MVRFRENVEGVALYGGEADEKAVFGERFGAVIENWWTFMWRIKKVTFLTASYGQTAVAFPFLINFGRLFNGSITLGTLMQISNSFGEVQKALSFFVGAYTTMADWKATVDRLTQFTGAIGAVKRENAGRRDIAIAVAPGSNELNVQDLDLALPQGQVLQRDIDLRVVPGDSVLVRGPSGAGKTTLVRAIAGLWPFGKGRVDLPAQGNTLFLPQKPYLPVGPLRMVVAYPAATTGFSDDKIREALTAVGLGHLTGRLDESRHWAQTLSVGEQQRIAFARALLLEPEWLYLDEATSQLDEDAEGLLYALLRKRLPQAAIVSIGHRHTLVPLHKRELVLAAPLTQLAAE